MVESKPHDLAVTAAMVLRDWEKYGVAERVCFHFDLSEALAASEQERSDPNDTNRQLSANQLVCGVQCLLECIPAQIIGKRHRRALRNEMLRFNQVAALAMRERRVFCHEPPNLPLRFNPSTRVFYCYETTRIAFCLDASATLTSTFGFGSSTKTERACCPMDRLVHMAHTFFTAVIQPISTPHATATGIWKPELAVSVLAIYPSELGQADIGLLVRDFRITDVESAELLSKNIEEWALGEVETEIARRLSRRRGRRPNSYDAWSMSSHTSSLVDILNAGDAALSTLSSAARPCIVVATDCCSVTCNGVLDSISDKERVDVPVVVLDLSSPESHVGFENDSSIEMFELMTFDPTGAVFPLHLSDDTEALYSLCKASGGAFWDSSLLTEAALTIAGEVPVGSSLSSDAFFAFARYSMKPNAVQWYTLFSLSPLSPRASTSGILAPPLYLRNNIRTKTPIKELSSYTVNRRGLHHLSSGAEAKSGLVDSGVHRKPTQMRTVFFTYSVGSMPIKGLLMIRLASNDVLATSLMRF
jgi:hypothetical protein